MEVTVNVESCIKFHRGFDTLLVRRLIRDVNIELKEVYETKASNYISNKNSISVPMTYSIFPHVFEEKVV